MASPRGLGGVEALDLVRRVRLHQVLGLARTGIEADLAPGRPAKVAKVLALAHGQLAHGTVGVGHAPRVLRPGRRRSGAEAMLQLRPRSPRGAGPARRRPMVISVTSSIVPASAFASAPPPRRRVSRRRKRSPVKALATAIAAPSASAPSRATHALAQHRAGDARAAHAVRGQSDRRRPARHPRQLVDDELHRRHQVGKPAYPCRARRMDRASSAGPRPRTGDLPPATRQPPAQSVLSHPAPAPDPSNVASTPRLSIRSLPGRAIGVR